MVHSMKMGWMKTPTQRKKELEEAQKDTQVFYDIWSNEDEVCHVVLPIHLRIRICEIYAEIRILQASMSDVGDFHVQWLCTCLFDSMTDSD